MCGQAAQTLKRMGFAASFGKHVREDDMMRSSSVEARIEDLHEAFSDERVSAVMTAIGGYNANQLLGHIDYDLIKNNPKILCGYSDCTVLSNALYAKTGLVSYSGPHFSTFGMKKGLAYTEAYFTKCLVDDGPFIIASSKEWSDDAWYKDQEARRYHRNNGYTVLREGEAEGTIVGGNLCTFGLLRGTHFMPSLGGSILFLEDDNPYCDDSFAVEFDRNLQSLIHLPEFSGVRGILIGRSEGSAHMTDARLLHMVETKPELSKIPIVAGVDFGHTTPHITFPIGGTMRMKVGRKKIVLEILTH